jgi:hypothetical protein
MLLLRQQPVLTGQSPWAAMFRAACCAMPPDISIDKKDIG